MAGEQRLGPVMAEFWMKRLDLPVATRRPAADAARIPAYIGTPERVAASQMTAFTTVFQTHTGRTFASHADLHDCSVREVRTFWHCFLHWTPGIDWSGDGRGCNTIAGWFVVDSVTYSAGSLASIDLRFEQHCEGVPAALHGAIHWIR